MPLEAFITYIYVYTVYPAEVQYFDRKKLSVIIQISLSLSCDHSMGYSYYRVLSKYRIGPVVVVSY